MTRRGPEPLVTFLPLAALAWLWGKVTKMGKVDTDRAVGAVLIVLAFVAGTLIGSARQPTVPVSPPNEFIVQQLLPEDRALDWVDLGILEVYFPEEDCTVHQGFAAYSDHMIIVVCTEDETLKQKLLDIEQWLRDHPHGWRLYLPAAGQLLWFPVLRKRG